jgi:hypothetical protein
MLKQVVFAILAVLSVLFGILCALNIVYNLEPLSRGVPLDTEGKLTVAVLVLLTPGSFLAAYWLFRRSANHESVSKNP